MGVVRRSEVYVNTWIEWKNADWTWASLIAYSQAYTAQVSLSECIHCQFYFKKIYISRFF